MCKGALAMVGRFAGTPLAVLLVACTSTTPRDTSSGSLSLSPSPARPSAAPPLFASSPAVPSDAPSPSALRRLTLTEVHELVQSLSSRRLAAASFHPVEARSRVEQAGLWPNPYVMLRKREVSDFDLIDSGMSELEVGQPFELGGKRAARVDSLRAESDVAEASFGAACAETLRDAEEQFTKVLRLQEEIELVRVEAETASALAVLVEARHEAGRESRVVLLERQSEAERARLQVQDLEREHSRACRELDDLLGLTAGTTLGVEGDWQEVCHAAPDREQTLAALASHPRRVAAELSVTAAERAQRRAEADVWPDLMVGVAYEHREETEDDLLGCYVSVPLPLWDRRQGLRSESRAAAARARSTLEAETLELTVALEAAWLTFERARHNVTGYEEDILPRLEESLVLTRQAHDAGRASRIEVLESELILFRARQQRLRHREDQARAAAEIRYLVAGDPPPAS
ncbi:MAG: TolC family protein [Planctomycetota bacterium]